MQGITYTNSLGKSIVFGNNPPFILTEINGLGDVEANIQSQKSPYQDGETYVDTLLEPRFIEMEIKIIGKDIDNNRRYLSKVMNPKLRGILKFENGSIVREIEGINEHVPKYTEKNLGYQLALVNIECPDPYWRDPNQRSEPLQSYVGNFKLPMTFPFQLGLAGSRTVLYNEGDETCPVTIDIHGPTTNPQVINKTTGDYIRINRVIADDEILHINTASGQQRVEIYRGNVIEQGFGYLDHNSELFMLEIGENEIEHIADAGDSKSLVAISWQSRYVGV